MSKRKPFDPRFPRLRKVAYSDRYGRMELISVSITSDRFLLGWAKFGTGKNAEHHSVFLGRVENFI